MQENGLDAASGAGHKENFTIGKFSAILYRVFGYDLPKVDDTSVLVLEFNKLLSGKELFRETSTEAVVHE